MNDALTGILRPEVMLRTAQAEITDLRARLAASADVILRLERQLGQATATFCAAVLQAGGSVTLTPEEQSGTFRLQRHEDPATHARTFTVTREPGPRPLEVVQ
jgi:hypothetical protein